MTTTVTNEVGFTPITTTPPPTSTVKFAISTPATVASFSKPAVITANPNKQAAPGVTSTAGNARLLPKQQPLDITAEFERLRNQYKEDVNTQKINILLLGETGSGKTYLLRTAPSTPEKPNHIDSFDPGGATSLRDKIASGHIIASSWEHEDPFNPTMFRLWEAEMERRIAGDYFSHISTYMLDSATTFSQAVMNQVLKQGGVAGQTPRRNKDYMPQKTAITNWVSRILTLPCNVIITGHLKLYEKYNEKGEVIKSEKRFMTVGDTYITIPLKFDEIYCMQPKDSSKGVQYRILTRSTGDNIARSRLSMGGLLEQYEEANLEAMLRKAKFIQ